MNSEDTKANAKSKLKAIEETLQEERWKPLEYVRGPGSIKFSPEISIDVEKAKCWSLNITAIPNQGRMEQHSHYFLAEKEIIELHEYLGKLRKHLETLK